MQLLTPLLGTLGVSGAVTGGTAAAGAASGTSLLTALQVAGTGLSVFGSLSQASAQASAMRTQATGAKIAAQQELQQGREESISIRRALVRNLASNRAAAGASGIDVGSGSVRTGEIADIREAGRARTSALTGASLRRRTRVIEASSLRSGARAVEQGGLLRSGLAISDLVTDFLRRG